MNVMTVMNGTIGVYGMHGPNGMNGWNWISGVRVMNGMIARTVCFECIVKRVNNTYMYARLHGSNRLTAATVGHMTASFGPPHPPLIIPIKLLNKPSTT